MTDPAADFLADVEADFAEIEGTQGQQVLESPVASPPGSPTPTELEVAPVTIPVSLETERVLE